MRFNEFKPVKEARLIHPKFVDVFYKPSLHNKEARRVAERIPTSTLDFLIRAMCKKFGVSPEDFVWKPVDNPYGHRLDSELEELIQPELNDNKGFELTRHDELGLTYTAFSKGNRELVIEVKTATGDIIAQAIFRTTENDDDLNSDDTWVDKKYRRMGIATKMYNWAQELGNTVVPSKFRSQAGKKFWRSRLNELDFMGHTCTKDCSGHRAGYQWSLTHNGSTAQTPSSSFNNGTEIGNQKHNQRAQGGGKRPQFVSQTPNAIRKREARIQAKQLQQTTIGDTSKPTGQ